MWILGLEAGAAALLLIFLVWWTMFSGRAPEQESRPRQTERQTERKSGQPDTPAGPGGEDATGS